MNFWQSADWRRYCMAATWGESEDCTIDIVRNGVDIAQVSLIREGDKFTFQGGACPRPLRKYYKPDMNVDEIIFEGINSKAHKIGVKYIHITGGDSVNFLKHTGYTFCRDLTEVNYQTHTMRKGVKSAINKGKKHLISGISMNVNQFMKDYFEIAGKQTRPEASFEILQEFVDRGICVLFKAMYGNETAGYTMIMIDECGNKFMPHVNNEYAYYFMSGSFDKFREYNVGHFLQDAVIEYLREIDIKDYVFGEQVYNDLYHCPDEKEWNISFFKRGFGGYLSPYSHSEYWWDKNLCKEVLEKRVKDYYNSL